MRCWHLSNPGGDKTPLSVLMLLRNFSMCKHMACFHLLLTAHDLNATLYVQQPSTRPVGISYPNFFPFRADSLRLVSVIKWDVNSLCLQDWMCLQIILLRKHNVKYAFLLTYTFFALISRLTPHTCSLL